MNYESNRPKKRITQSMATGGYLPSNRNFYDFREKPPSILWQGYDSCHNTISIAVYTKIEHMVLSIGTILYINDQLSVIYPNPYFVYEGVRYTVNSGEITIIEMCDLYML